MYDFTSEERRILLLAILFLQKTRKPLTHSPGSKFADISVQEHVVLQELIMRFKNALGPQSIDTIIHHAVLT